MAVQPETPVTPATGERQKPGRKAAEGVRVATRIPDSVYAALEDLRWSGRYDKVGDLVAEILVEGITARTK